MFVGAVVAALTFGAVASADFPVADGDGAVPVSTALNPLNAGNRCVGSSTDFFVPVAIQRGAEADTDLLRTFKNSAGITLTVGADSGTGFGEISESFTEAGADNSITLESNWTSLSAGTMSADIGTLKVHLTPTTTGAKAVTVPITATGPNINNVNINRSQPGGFKINWTGVTCDTDPPAVTHTIGTPSFTSGSDTFVTSATTLNFNVNETAHGNSGLSSCTVSVDGPTTNDGNFTCVEGNNNYTLSQLAPLSLANAPPDGSYANSASATDNFSNTGNDSFTVLLDNTAPTFGSCTGGPFLLNSGGGSQPVSITADDGTGSGVDSGASTLSGNVDTTSVGTKTVNYTAVDNLGNTRNTSCDYDVIFDFHGFFPPVENPSDHNFNDARAGRAIPVKFDLGGDQGLNIFAAGYPKSIQVDCDTAAVINGAVSTVNPGGSSLHYDSTVNPPIGQYNYVWKTDRAWADTCRRLDVMLIDGTTHSAYFDFST